MSGDAKPPIDCLSQGAHPLAPPRECAKKKPPSENEGFKELGDVLLSHHLSVAVPSALQGLTAVFGMGTGVPPVPLPPKMA